MSADDMPTGSLQRSGTTSTLNLPESESLIMELKTSGHSGFHFAREEAVILQLAKRYIKLAGRSEPIVECILKEHEPLLRHFAGTTRVDAWTDHQMEEKLRAVQKVAELHGYRIEIIERTE